MKPRRPSNPVGKIAIYIPPYGYATLPKSANRITIYFEIITPDHIQIYANLLMTILYTSKILAPLYSNIPNDNLFNL
jgi:hypothetical protein